MNEGTTHYAGCIQAGPKHYECALQEIGRLRLTITHLRAELEKETQRRFDGNEIASKEHREEVADLQVKLEAADNRNTAMMRMGDRLIAERAQSEYICTCGIRVTPHKCPTDNGF